MLLIWIVWLLSCEKVQLMYEWLNIYFSELNLERKTCHVAQKLCHNDWNIKAVNKMIGMSSGSNEICDKLVSVMARIT